MNTEHKHIVPIELITRVLSGEAAADEKHQLEIWRTKTAENEKEYQAIAKLWNITESASGKADINLDKEWQVQNQKISGNKGRMISLNRVLQIAAAVVMVFGLAFFLNQQIHTVATKTAEAEITKVSLPDGTIISLNASSKITYDKDFGQTNRNISLKGEGFFDVASNKELPFVVQAQGASIRVVGTQFNIKAYKYQDQVKVTVIEGTVELYESKMPAKRTTLIAGETGVFVKKKKAIQKRAIHDINDISWKTKHIRFENTKLEDVITILNNTYHHNFELADHMKACRVTVEFHDKDLAAVLKVLKSTLDLKISMDKDLIVISGKGCQN